MNRREGRRIVESGLVLGQIKNGTGRDGGACVWGLGQ